MDDENLTSGIAHLAVFFATDITNTRDTSKSPFLFLALSIAKGNITSPGWMAIPFQWRNTVRRFSFLLIFTVIPIIYRITTNGWLSSPRWFNSTPKGGLTGILVMKVPSLLELNAKTECTLDIV